MSDLNNASDRTNPAVTDEPTNHHPQSFTKYLRPTLVLI